MKKINMWMKSNVAVALLAGLAFAVPAHAQKQIAKTFYLPVQVQGGISLSGCSNSPGPVITLDGATTLGGLNIGLTFQNNLKGTHTYTAENSVEVIVVPAGGSIELPKQPVRGGVGGNPFIWVQFLDGSGNAVSGEIFLGRCVQGPFKVDTYLPVEVSAVANFTALDCTNHPGPYITVEGAATFKGINAQFIFRNNDNPVGGPHEAVRSAQVVVIPAGFTLQFPKQPPLGGVGGNPWIFAQFEQSDGTPIGDEYLLGRCVQLVPGN